MVSRQGHWGPLALLLLILAGGMLIAVSLVLGWRRPPPPAAPVARIYARFCHKLSRHGLSRATHEGPLDYAQRVNRQRPEWAKQVNAITSLYIELRYADSGHLKRFATLVREFKPESQ